MNRILMHFAIFLLSGCAVPMTGVGSAQHPPIQTTKALLLPIEMPNEFDVCEFVANRVSEGGEAKVGYCDARSWLSTLDGVQYFAASFDQPTLQAEWDAHWGVPWPESNLSISPEGRISTFDPSPGVLRCYSIAFVELNSDGHDIRLIVDAESPTEVDACKAQ